MSSLLSWASDTLKAMEEDIDASMHDNARVAAKSGPSITKRPKKRDRDSDDDTEGDDSNDVAQQQASYRSSSSSSSSSAVKTKDLDLDALLSSDGIIITPTSAPPSSPPPSSSSSSSSSSASSTPSSTTVPSTPSSSSSSSSSSTTTATTTRITKESPPVEDTSNTLSNALLSFGGFLSDTVEEEEDSAGEVEEKEEVQREEEETEGGEEGGEVLDAGHTTDDTSSVTDAAKDEGTPTSSPLSVDEPQTEHQANNDTASEELRRVQQQNKAEMARVTAGFTKRFSELQNALRQVRDERDSAKKELQSNRTDEYGDDKDVMIAELREEGQKLSMKQQTMEANMKKLRARRKDDEEEINNSRQRLSSIEDLLEKKVTRLKELEETERSYRETISNMKGVSESAARKLDEGARNLDKHRTQVDELQAALERSWRELAEQKKINSGLGGQTELKILEVEKKVREEYHEQMRKQDRLGGERESQLEQTVGELRAALARQVERAGWREEEYRKEVHEFQLRLQEAEERTQELATSVPDSTRPLLRQIEALQSSHQARQQAWEGLEASLVQRLAEAEETAARASSAADEAVTEVNEYRAKMRAVESQLSSERSSNARLTAEAETLRTVADEAKRELFSVQGELETFQSTHKRTVHDLRTGEKRLIRQIAEAKAREQHAYRDLEEAQKRQPTSATTTTTSTSNGGNGSAGGSDNAGSSSVNGILDATSLNGRGGGGKDMRLQMAGLGDLAVASAATVERLRAVLYQREGEVKSLQSHISHLENGRRLLEDELVNLTSKNEGLLRQMKDTAEVNDSVRVLQSRYATSLEMLGEKEEQVEELKADLYDMKQLYRTQVTELLLRIEEKEKETTKT